MVINVSSEEAWKTPSDILRILTKIRDDPVTRVLFSSTDGGRQAGGMWKVEQRLCLAYLGNTWLESQQIAGLVKQSEDGTWVATDMWTIFTVNPIRTLMNKLKGKYKRDDKGVNHFERRGVDRIWTRQEDIPKDQLKRFMDKFPYYFVLMELVNQKESSVLDHNATRLPSQQPSVTSAAETTKPIQRASKPSKALIKKQSVNKRPTPLTESSKVEESRTVKRRLFPEVVITSHKKKQCVSVPSETQWDQVVPDTRQPRKSGVGLSMHSTSDRSEKDQATPRKLVIEKPPTASVTKPPTFPTAAEERIKDSITSFQSRFVVSSPGAKPNGAEEDSIIDNDEYTSLDELNSDSGESVLEAKVVTFASTAMNMMGSGRIQLPTVSKTNGDKRTLSVLRKRREQVLAFGGNAAYELREGEKACERCQKDDTPCYFNIDRPKKLKCEGCVTGPCSFLTPTVKIPAVVDRIPGVVGCLQVLVENEVDLAKKGLLVHCIKELGEDVTGM